MAATVVRAVLAACFMLAAALANSAEVPPPAYQLIALPAGVPSEVLYSVALQESGTRLRGQIVPWPWTLNVARRLPVCDPKRCVQGFDDCASNRWSQSGRRWSRSNQHRCQWPRYSSPCEGLDPYKNLSVTAQILAEQKAKGGDWITAAGRYHRPAGGEPAARYRRAFAKHLSRVTGINLMANNP